ncbi:hypothetical protein F2Q70_00037968 [Brassica cretica]|uniref:Uncharacterized protein n=1 Tax=Brassica cretica TaxID=69181 RepID=A0A8S9K9B7_BRACR|nr:hypothetical protein F2Q70_00037968 [Brassica cretica]
MKRINEGLSEMNSDEEQKGNSVEASRRKKAADINGSRETIEQEKENFQKESAEEWSYCGRE